MKRFIAILVVLLALAIATPVLAASPIKGIEPKIGTKIVLDNNVESVYKGKDAKGQHIYEATISGLPIYTDDLQTKIDPSWHYNDKTKEWVAGANLFEAIVDAYGTKVTITKDGEFMVLDPNIKIDGYTIKPLSKVPTMVNDYYNPNYSNNTLQWDYGIFKRQIRIIEGCIFQYLIFDSNPNGDVNIDSPKKTIGFTWDRGNEAWDADGNAILVSDNLVYASEFNEAIYPVVIDPSPSFDTSASDGYLASAEDYWYDARIATTASSVYKTSTTLRVYTWSTGGGADSVINRAFVYFDTSAIPDGVTLTDAALYLRLSSKVDDDNAGVYIVQGMSTYPHDPLVAGDYRLTNYGSFSSTYGWSDGSNISSGYNKINFSDSTTLKGIVNKSGTTKLCLIERADKENDTPGADDGNYFSFYSYEQGIGYRPYITVTYATTAPSITAESASSISYTSAQLNSVVNDDGGEACDVRFGYGKASQAAVDFESYTVKTAWVEDTYVTGNHPYFDASSLDSNDTYYYRAQIRNSDSTVTSTNEITFDTLNDILDVTDLRAYPSVTSVLLNWTKPSGATNTMVRYALDTYPATEADGEQIYFGTGNNVTHNGVTGGTTYYYSAWGESGGNYSTSADNVAITTQPFGTEGGDLEGATQPAGWYQAPDYTSLSGLGFFYDGTNNLADDIGMPRATAWLGLMIAIATGAAFLLYWRTHNVFATVGGACFILVAGYFMQLVPLWMMIVTIIAGIGIMVARRQA